MFRLAPERRPNHKSQIVNHKSKGVRAWRNRGEATRLPAIRKATPKIPVIGVFATSDPRIDEDSRTRCQNIAQMAAETISGAVVLPDKTPVPVVYSTVLVDGEAQADIVAQQFQQGRRRYPGLRAGYLGLPAADA